jgi:hypothetical protein
MLRNISLSISLLVIGVLLLILGSWSASSLRSWADLDPDTPRLLVRMQQAGRSSCGVTIRNEGRYPIVLEVPTRQRTKPVRPPVK